MRAAVLVLLALGSLPPRAGSLSAAELPVSASVPLGAGVESAVPEADRLRVAAIQTTNFVDGKLRTAAQEIADKTTKVVGYIHHSAELGADIAVFPEMVLTRYDAALIANGTAADIAAAETRIAAACREAKVWAIVGLPKYLQPSEVVEQATCNSFPAGGSRWWNTALVFNAAGEKVYRQAKLRCGGPDGQLGQWLDVFQGPKNITSSVQICADAGDPNIARLPALAGSRIIYDISAESGINSYSKIVPYIAQYQARAHESHAFLVQSNVGATFDTANAAGEPYGPDNTGLLDAQGGSHGNSLVIAPDGNILLKAPVFGEFAALQDLDMRLARGGGGYTPHKFMEPFYDAGRRLLSRMPID